MPRRNLAVMMLLLPVACGGAQPSPAVPPPVAVDRRIDRAPAALAMREQHSGRPWSLKTDGRTYRMEVRAGDHIPNDGNDPKERSEFYSSAKLDMRRTYAVRFRMRVDPGRPNTAAWLVLAQFQSSFDKGEAGHSPPLALGLKGERMTIGTNTSAAKISTPATIRRDTLYTDRAPIRRGHWYDMLFRVRFDPAGKGEITVVRDGRSLVTYRGPVGFNDDVGPYLKAGVYRAAAPERFIVRVTDLSIRPLK